MEVVANRGAIQSAAVHTPVNGSAATTIANYRAYMASCVSFSKHLRMFLLELFDGSQLHRFDLLVVEQCFLHRRLLFGTRSCFGICCPNLDHLDLLCGDGNLCTELAYSCLVCFHLHGTKLCACAKVTARERERERK